MKVIAAFEQHLAGSRDVRGVSRDAFGKYMETIAFCRHRVVHNDGRVSVPSMNTLEPSGSKRMYANACMTASTVRTSISCRPRVHRRSFRGGRELWVGYVHSSFRPMRHEGRQ